MIFVDYLFILSAASGDSLEFVRRTIVEFRELSGLHPDFHKCSMFITGVEPDVKVELSNLMGRSCM